MEIVLEALRDGDIALNAAPFPYLIQIYTWRDI